MPSTQIDRLGLVPPVRVFTGPTAVCQIVVGDSIVEINAGSVAVTCVLPPYGGPYTIVDGAGVAATFPITVLNALGGTVGTISANGGSAEFAWDGTRMVPVLTGVAIPPFSVLTTIASWFGALRRLVSSKLYDQMSVADFGAVGDNTTNDTAAIQAAINAATSIGRRLDLVGLTGNNFRITAPLTVTGPLRVSGVGLQQSILTASGNFAAVLAFAGAAAQVWLEHFSIVTTGTTTRCVNLAQGGQGLNFSQVEFDGDVNGILVYSQAAGYITFDQCVWNCNSATTLGVNLDGFNQNVTISGGHAGGIGIFIVLSNSTGNIANNVQGMKMVGFTSICTGSVAVTIAGAAFGNFLTDCIIDQATDHCVVIEGGAMLTQIVGGYYGVTNNTTGSPILLTNGAGPGNTIDSIETFGGASAIQVQAVGSVVGGVAITNNLFSSATSVTVSLDSVNGCIIEGNEDLSTPTNGSWGTAATLGLGVYTFGGNSWSTAAITSAHSTSSYHATPDRGRTLANKGVSSAVSGSALVVAHGCVLPPSIIQVTQLGGAGMSSNVSAIGATTFTINYSVPGAATFMWTAEVYD